MEARNIDKYLKTKVLLAIIVAKTETTRPNKLQIISTWRKRVIHSFSPVLGSRTVKSAELEAQFLA
jgi:hypothetical protein